MQLLLCLVLLVTISIVYGQATCSPVVPTCSNPPATIGDRRQNKNQLTVATFNAEWLFWSNGANGPSTRCPRDHSAGTCPWDNAYQLTEHLKFVSELLKQHNIDIIALQEVQDCTILQCLISAIGDSSYKPYLIPGTDTATNQNVGLLSRIDPISPVWRSGNRATIKGSNSPCRANPSTDYDSGVSKHFVSTFAIAGIGEISMIGAHLLSQPTDPINCIKRECQATVLRSLIVTEMAKGRQVIMLGDLNDYDADVLDINNNKPTSRVSKILKYDNSGVKDLWNVASKVPQSDRYSDWWDKDNNCIITPAEFSLIDHLLVTAGLESRIKTVQFINKYDFSCGTYASDHFPIKVTFSTTNL